LSLLPHIKGGPLPGHWYYTIQGEKDIIHWIFVSHTMEVPALLSFLLPQLYLWG
jgi:hypothetical protein